MQVGLSEGRAFILVHGSRCAFAEARQAPSEFEAGNFHPARNGAIAANCKHKPLSPTACQLALSRLVLWIGMADGVYLSSMDLLLLEAWLRNDLVELGKLGASADFGHHPAIRMPAIRDSEKLENHYAVTFYASCGWAFMSLCSLFSVVYQSKYPEFAFDVLLAGNAVFAVACIYFYSYHWSRMYRHFTQNRFRPLWIPGLLGLMALHSLTPLDLMKRLDDPGWWKTVCQVYSDEWWWVADVRIIEFVTAAALLLIIMHIQGVFTGMKNAAVVVIGTIFAPLGLMVLESTWLRASAWQHYLMVGPKYW
ncbi:unnamed protein product [Effrenium voratum]|nr:unnamed protein product [Effrenium voratum]